MLKQLKQLFGIAPKKKYTIFTDPIFGEYFKELFRPKYHYLIPFKMGEKEFWTPHYTYPFFSNTVYKGYMEASRMALDIHCRKAYLPLFIGVGEDNKPKVADLQQLRHLFVSGAQGGGKTVGLLSLMTSLIYLAPPDLYHLHIFDKKGDLSPLAPFGSYYHTLDEMKKGLADIKRKYEHQKNKRIALGPANIEACNDIYIKAKQSHMLYNIILVDEFFELKKNLEEAWGMAEHITSIGRSDGFYFILGTQRTDYESVSTTARSNAMTRISFWQRDARESNIAGVKDAEKLTKAGDFVFSSAMIKSKKFSIPRTSHEEMKIFLQNLVHWGGKEKKQMERNKDEKTEKKN